MRITIEQLQEGEFVKETWIFWYYESANCLVLDEYRKEQRNTKRHKFTTVTSYSRIKSRNSSAIDRLEESEVPLPIGITERALMKFFEHMRVVKWSEVSR